MDSPRCAVCTEKTNKRMVRPAPLNFADITAQLHTLQSIVAACNLPTPDKAPAKVRDGYGPADATSLARIQAAQQIRARSAATNVIDLDAVPVVQHRCRLCPKGVDPISFPPSVQFGAMMPALCAKKSRNLFAHERCALFSQDVYELDGTVHNVERAVMRSNKIVCSRDPCGRTRANVTCAADSCSVAYHFPCAVVAGCAIVEDGYKMFCFQHRALAPEIDEGEFAKVMSNPADADAMEHEDSCYLCLTGGRLLMCDTCVKVAHPACAGLKALPDGDWSCGVCTGDHTMSQVEEDRSVRARKRRNSAKRRRVDSGEGDEYNPVREKRARARKKARRSVDTGPKYFFCNTGLGETQKEMLYAVAKAKKVVMRPELDKKVTHLIVRSNTKQEMPLRTMKLCLAIASKTPIMCWKWVEDSKLSAELPSPEPYLHPLTWPCEQPSAFTEMRFIFGVFEGAREKKDALMKLVVAGGGTVMMRDPSYDSASGLENMYYVFDGEHTDHNRRELLSRLEPPPEANVVSSGWILDRLTKNRY